MDSIQLEIKENIAILTLNRSVTNPINLRLLNELEKAIKNIDKDPAISGFVLTSSSEKFFSIGFDIPEIYYYNKEEFRIFFKKFNRICLDFYTISKPTIAALPGHGVAGGCIFAICFDYRFIAEGRNLMGLNEIKLGIPLPYVCDCILRNLVGYKYARDLADFGDYYEPAKLLEIGLVDRIVPPEQVLRESINQVKKIGETSLRAFKMIKKNRVEPVVQQIHTLLEAKEDFFVDCWYSDEARELQKKAMEKF